MLRMRLLLKTLGVISLTNTNGEANDKKRLSFIEKFLGLVKENGFIQGILGALSIIATIPNITSIERSWDWHRQPTPGWSFVPQFMW